MSTPEAMRDSEFAKNIPTSWGGQVGGYLQTGDPAHAWAPEEWNRFPHHKKVPIVAMSRALADRRNPDADAASILRELWHLGVPRGVFVWVDYETTTPVMYAQRLGSLLEWAGLKVISYGSVSTVFALPKFHGYAVAHYAERGPFLETGSRWTQYASPSTGSGGEWDSSACRVWTRHNGKFWV